MKNQRGSNLLEVTFLLALVVGVAFTSFQFLGAEAGRVIAVFGGANDSNGAINPPNLAPITESNPPNRPGITEQGDPRLGVGGKPVHSSVVIPQPGLLRSR